MNLRYLVFSSLFHIKALSVFAENVGYFWHLTDFHYDPNFSVHGDSNYRCHLMGKGSDNMYSPIFGDYVCDTPFQLINSLVHFMILQKQDADFVIWTGSNGSADEGNMLSRIIQSVEDIYHELSHLKHTKIYPALGWNDFKTIWKSPTNSTIAHLFNSSLTNESMDQFSKTGCYSEVHNIERLLIVIFNTNLLVEENDASSLEDPAGIWSWLRKELLRARKKGLKVYLIMSVPPGIFESGLSIPGVHWFRPKHNRKYIVMVREFRDVIMGQFAGHQHIDTFRVLYNRNEIPLSWLLLAPSLAPNSLNTAKEVSVYSNPGARLYEYDKETFEVLDYTQFSFNLTDCNIKEIKCWKKAYSFTERYKVQQISALSLRFITDQFQTDPEYFKNYYNGVYSGMYSAKSCDEWCAYYHTCAIHNVDYSSFLECIAGWYPAKSVPGLMHHIWKQSHIVESSFPGLSLHFCLQFSVLLIQLLTCGLF